MHLTTGKLSLTEQDAFINFCEQQEVKPLLIELDRGKHIQQPMLSEVAYLPNLEEALKLANHYSSEMQHNGFEVVRIKIEVPATKADLFPKPSAQFNGYFEWHGKVDYEQVDDLTMLCAQHQAHLSLNALKNQTTSRYVTLREYGDFEKFTQRREALITAFQEGNWNLRKEHSEYCVYDNNVLLDDGWLVV